MKRLLVILFLLACGFALSAQADTTQTLDTTPAQASQAVYADTLSRLEQQSARGIRNADLYYDLGVCHYQLGERGEAVLNFLRALNIDSAHKQARENLDFINATSTDLPREPEQPYLAQLFLRIYDFFSLNRLALVVLILAFLTTLSLHLLFHYPPEKERGLPVLAVLVCAILLLAFGSALAVKNHRYLHNSKAVVLKVAELKSTQASGRKLKKLLPGTTVTVKEKSGAQLQVILPDGLSGWIDSKAAEMVVPNQ